MTLETKTETVAATGTAAADLLSMTRMWQCGSVVEVVVVVVEVWCGSGQWQSSGPAATSVDRMELHPPALLPLCILRMHLIGVEHTVYSAYKAKHLPEVGHPPSFY